MAVLPASTENWTPDSWRAKPTYQQFTWPDHTELQKSLKTLRNLPPLVFAGEARTLRQQLAKVCAGEAFLLQAGDCAESFNKSVDSIRDMLRIILQMAIVLTYSAGVPVVKVGRLAGQFAKPRTRSTEIRSEIELPVFMGHMINELGFSQSERTPDPDRMITAHHKAASTLNLLRGFTCGGYADLGRVAHWNREFVQTSPAGQRYAQLATEIDKALQFIKACGVNTSDIPQLHSVQLFSSHEALVLDFEEAMTRIDSITGGWYDCSAHMLWLGSNSLHHLQQVDDGHVEFLRGVNNPIGCKVNADVTPDTIIDLCERLNPHHVQGRLTLISRMGADKIRTHLPPLLLAIKESDHPIAWVCDPMHGNTYTAPSGHKTRHFDTVLSEIEGFFAAHLECGTWPGGVHLELTGDHVTECLGGSDDITDDELIYAFETLCDPRLNARQSLDLAFRVAEMLAAAR